MYDSMSPGPTKALRTEILRSVSRSFYLSIRFLPVQLREPIALAYLLARTTDTVADTAQISRSVRMETLELLSNGIQGIASRDVVLELVASFVSLQENTSERQLLESIPDCLACLEGMAHADRNDIRLVLEKITRGQMLDLQRFDNPQEIRALSTCCRSRRIHLSRGWLCRRILDATLFPARSPVLESDRRRDACSGKALRHGASTDQCVARRRLRSSSWKMLFSRTRIKRSASDSLADPLRTGALPADLSNVAG